MNACFWHTTDSEFVCGAVTGVNNARVYAVASLVPEPAAACLLGSSILALVGWNRRLSRIER